MQKLIMLQMLHYGGLKMPLQRPPDPQLDLVNPPQRALCTPLILKTPPHCTALS